MEKQSRTPSSVAAAAELVGTFILVFAGCGGIMVEARDEVLTYVGVNAIFGLVIMAMIYSLGHISGAHINPSASLAFSAVVRLSVKELPIYIVSQIAGATAAAALLHEIITNTSINVAVTVPVGNPFASLHGQKAGIAVGGIAACNGLLAGYAWTLSGCSMNPARSLGPALIAGKYNDLGVYIVGPVSGAICGAWFYKAITIA
ncbi:aquaporin NIP1-1-like [Cryptomeria japonica]|uniref:aquaporin NIP1-1-like n=1 Tax=Cryptomeria japonica TaxID=3369 RepID=UPI0027DAA0CE|nr:aquaporin NIP1-1-like [Cryptomeria japonica]